MKTLVISAVLLVSIVLLVTNPRGLYIAAWTIVGSALLVALANLYQSITGGFESSYLGLAQPFRDPIGHVSRSAALSAIRTT